MIFIRKTKIVCTIGPATESLEEIKKLVQAGMNVARINLSHGDEAEYRKIVKNVKKASPHIGILFDTQGPEIRTGMIKKGVKLKKGQSFTLTTKKIVGDEKKVSITYRGLPAETKKKDILLIDDGLIALQVQRVEKTNIRCKVKYGGKLGNQKSVNHPGGTSRLPNLTKKDKQNIKLGKKLGITFIAASFVRKKADVQAIKKELKGSPIKIFAKIENQEGVDNYEEILEEADGIMVARGDLGVELPQETMPIIQKRLIGEANRIGKPVITATQMLASMVNSPRPTRAETTDVANAILDGSDAVMLSEETAVGHYPLHAVRIMNKIALNAEKELKLTFEPAILDTDDALAKAISDLVERTSIDRIITCTFSGHTTRKIAKFRPNAMIIAFTPDTYTLSRLSLLWGAYPLLSSKKVKSVRELIRASVKEAVRQGLVAKEENVIVTAAYPFNIRGKTNLIEIHKAGDILRE